jgi:hypothetical protein
LLDTLAHADETKAIMAIGGGESFTIILKFQSKFLPTLRRASNRRRELTSMYSLGLPDRCAVGSVPGEHRNLICFIIKRQMSCVESSSRDL